MHDVVIRGGTVVDGVGGPPRSADVAVRDGVIVDVGSVDGAARRVLDADGLLVTPGFVDIHTHYDGQATWDPHLTPSCWHGVTTAIVGNCGVGFAPVRPDDQQRLVELMEGVEDIPGTALYEGIRWDWRSFPEYLDALDRMPRALDIGVQLPHAALRAYVMGRGPRKTRRNPTWARCEPSCRRHSRRVLWASPPDGRAGIATCGATRYPAPSRPRASWGSYSAYWRKRVVGSSKWCPPASEEPRGSIPRVRWTASWTGCSAWLWLLGFPSPSWYSRVGGTPRAGEGGSTRSEWPISQGARLRPQVASRCFGALMGHSRASTPSDSRIGINDSANSRCQSWWPD